RRTYLPAGSTLTAEDRAAAERLLGKLRADHDAPESPKARLALIAKMLLGFPQTGGDERSGKARAELYLDALDDIPPIALQQALRQWSRAEAGDEHDYTWAPAPGVLRRLCLTIVERSRRDVRHLEDLLNAIPRDRAMDPKPIEAKSALVPTLRAM